MASADMDLATRIPFAGLVGLELVRMERGEAELVLQLRPEICNGWSVAHGGALMTLLDVAMASAARSSAADGSEESSSVVTIEMKTSFMRPGEGRLVASARRLHRTASLAFCEATVTGGDGKLVAQSTGTFKYMRALAVGGRRIQRLDASD
jgi:uncharacterized protein (TIGR00369 family)